MNKIKTFLTKISFIALILALLVGCNSGTTNKDKNTGTDSTTVTKEVKKLVYPLPTPFEVTQMLNKAGAGFILTVVNPVENVKKYFTEKSKAINLGVYGADLSYSSTYNMTDQVQKTFACTSKLTDDLGINTPFAQKIKKRIDDNITNKDSLYSIISSSYYDSFDYLNSNNKGAISVLIIAGGWIEGVYLSTELSAITAKNEEIIKGIAKQKSTIEPLMKLLNQYKDNKDVAEITVEVNKIKEIFDSMKEEKGEYNFTKEQFTKLTKVVAEVRKKIVDAQ